MDTSINTSLTIQERFFSKVEITDTCWIWKASAVPRGYGVFFAYGKQCYAHRFSYEMHIGKIENGMLICHKCDNPKCVNPYHLFQGSQKDNISDMVNKGRGNYRNRPKGDAHHMRKNPNQVAGEKNPSVKLKRDEVNEIRDLYKRGETQLALGKKFGIRQCHVSRIVRGESWAI